MSKTTFTGKGRLGMLLCLTGLLSFGTATAAWAQDASGSAANGGDPRYNSGDPQYNNDPRYNDNSNGNYAGRGDDPRYVNSQPDEDGGSPDAQDPPSRVARLSYLDGSVSFQAGGSGDWGNAAKNRPVTIGDKIWVDKDSRAELQAGQASIHLGAMTALSFLNLDQNITQMRLAEGSLNFRVRELREGDTYEVDTPNIAFTVREAGAFRIDVNENGDGTIVTVIRGEGEVTAGCKSHLVRLGNLPNSTEPIRISITTRTALPNRKILIAGLLIATAEKKIQFLRATFRATRWATQTSMITERGRRSRTMVRFGIPAASRWAGLLTVTDLGTMLGRGAGRGLGMSLGVLRRTTTDAGIISAAAGVGAQDRSATTQCTGRLSLDSLAAGLALV